MSSIVYYEFMILPSLPSPLGGVRCFQYNDVVNDVEDSPRCAQRSNHHKLSSKVSSREIGSLAAASARRIVVQRNDAAQQCASAGVRYEYTSVMLWTGMSR